MSLEPDKDGCSENGREVVARLRGLLEEERLLKVSLFALRRNPLALYRGLGRLLSLSGRAVRFSEGYHLRKGGLHVLRATRLGTPYFQVDFIRDWSQREQVDKSR